MVESLGIDVDALSRLPLLLLSNSVLLLVTAAVLLTLVAAVADELLVSSVGLLFVGDIVDNEEVEEEFCDNCVFPLLVQSGFRCSKKIKRITNKTKFNHLSVKLKKELKETLKLKIILELAIS